MVLEKKCCNALMMYMFSSRFGKGVKSASMQNPTKVGEVRDGVLNTTHNKSPKHAPGRDRMNEHTRPRADTIFNEVRIEVRWEGLSGLLYHTGGGKAIATVSYWVYFRQKLHGKAILPTRDRRPPSTLIYCCS